MGVSPLGGGHFLSRTILPEMSFQSLSSFLLQEDGFAGACFRGGHGHPPCLCWADWPAGL